MAKRYTDSEIWKKEYFRKWEKTVKLFWFYLKDNCNHAGIWNPDMELAEFQIGGKIPIEEVIKKYGDRIIVLEDGKWFISQFVYFQYNCSSLEELNPNNKVHKSVIDILNKYNLDKQLRLAPSKPLQRALEGGKDKDKDIRKRIEYNTILSNFFKQFWEIYPDRNGKKPGKQDALDFLMTKTCPIKPLQYPAVLSAVKEYAKSDQWKKDAVRFLKKDYWKGWVPARPAPTKAPEKPPIVKCGECGEKYQPVSENDSICSGCKAKFKTPEGQCIMKERKANLLKSFENLKKSTTPPPPVLQKKTSVGDSGIKR